MLILGIFIYWVYHEKKGIQYICDTILTLHNFSGLLLITFMIVIDQFLLLMHTQNQQYYKSRMSMSLPKIKSATEYGGSQSQKNLKFKKLKLSTDASGSQADIRARFKSVKTQRLNSLSRYSTVQEQRQYKNEKIHLNLLEKKLLTGTYDEAQQTGSDLNQLKQKIDQFKVQTIQKKQETQKLKEKVQEIKKEISVLEEQKKVKEQKIMKAERKVKKQKNRTEHMVEQRSVYDYMIETRKAVNLVLESRINEDKAYLTKIKSLNSITVNQLREVKEKEKNLQRQIEKINNDLQFQHKNREEIMYQKQSQIDKRKLEEAHREQKSKDTHIMFDEIEKEENQREFYASYSGILAHKFIARYADLEMNSLLGKYQMLENMFNRIGSYNKFNTQQPMEMYERYTNLDNQTKEYQQKIKSLQQQQIVHEQKNRRLLEKYETLKLTSKNSLTYEDYILKLQKAEQQGALTSEEEQNLEHMRKVEKLIRQKVEDEKLTQRIGRWAQKYAKDLDIGVKKGSTGDKILKNIQNILTIVRKDNKLVSERFSKKLQKQQNSKNEPVSSNQEQLAQTQSNQHSVS